MEHIELSRAGAQDRTKRLDLGDEAEGYGTHRVISISYKGKQQVELSQQAWVQAEPILRQLGELNEAGIRRALRKAPGRFEFKAVKGLGGLTCQIFGAGNTGIKLRRAKQSVELLRQLKTIIDRDQLRPKRRTPPPVRSPRSSPPRSRRRLASPPPPADPRKAHDLRRALARGEEGVDALRAELSQARRLAQGLEQDLHGQQRLAQAAEEGYDAIAVELAEAADQLEAVNERVRQLEAKLKEYEQGLAALEDANIRLSDELAAQDETIAHLERQVDANAGLQAQLDDALAGRAELQAQLEQIPARREERRAAQKEAEELRARMPQLEVQLRMAEQRAGEQGAELARLGGEVEAAMRLAKERQTTLEEAEARHRNEVTLLEGQIQDLEKRLAAQQPVVARAKTQARDIFEAQRRLELAQRRIGEIESTAAAEREGYEAQIVALEAARDRAQQLAAQRTVVAASGLEDENARLREVLEAQERRIRGLEELVDERDQAARRWEEATRGLAAQVQELTRELETLRAAPPPPDAAAIIAEKRAHIQRLAAQRDDLALHVSNLQVALGESNARYEAQERAVGLQLRALQAQLGESEKHSIALETENAWLNERHDALLARAQGADRLEADLQRVRRELEEERQIAEAELQHAADEIARQSFLPAQTRHLREQLDAAEAEAMADAELRAAQITKEQRRLEAERSVVQHEAEASARRIADLQRQVLELQGAQRENIRLRADLDQAEADLGQWTAAFERFLRQQVAGQ